MKAIVIYTVNAIITTAIVMFWMLYPNLTTDSEFPISLTIILVGTIICGYAPFIFEVVVKKLIWKK